MLSAEKFLRSPLFAGVSVSIVVHFAAMGGLTAYSVFGSRTKPEPPKSVKVSIKETPVAPPPEEPKIPPKPEPKPKKPEPKKLPPTQKPVPKEDSKPVEAVQGINPDAMVKDGKGLAAPVGNTLLKEDEGKRLKPDDVQQLTTDCTADARLIRESVVTPKYTDAALDANLEGVFIVDVFVDENGNVREAELRKKVGYGMDDRIIEVVKQSRFIPRKNKVCGNIAGWAEIKFSLVIP